MIRSFADEKTEAFYRDGSSKAFPQEIQGRALRKLDMIDSAFAAEDLRVPPGNRLHRLQGSRFGQYSISVNDRWRICFNFKDADAYDVELCDYH